MDEDDIARINAGLPPKNFMEAVEKMFNGDTIDMEEILGHVDHQLATEYDKVRDIVIK